MPERSEGDQQAELVGISLTNKLGQAPFVERLDMDASVRFECPQKSGNGRSTNSYAFLVESGIDDFMHWKRNKRNHSSYAKNPN